MSRPFVEFSQQPPVVLSCSEKREVRLKVKPRVAGPCTLTLSLVMAGCHFGNGEQQVKGLLQATAADDVLECVFRLSARADTPGNYFTILIAQAENADGEQSFQRPIELEIHCTGRALPLGEVEFLQPERPSVQPTVSDSETEEGEEPSDSAESSTADAEEEEENSEAVLPEELPPQPSAPSSPLSHVVEEADADLAEPAEELIDEVRPSPAEEAAEGGDAVAHSPSGKSQKPGGCLGVLLLLLGLTVFGACGLENPEIGISVNEVIRLQAEGEAQALPADGFSRLELTAVLGPKADANQSIVFFTEFGGFAEAGGENTYEVVASAKSATATLIAGTQVVEGALLTASVDGFTAEYPMDFLRSYPQDAVFTAGKLLLAADGLDFTELQLSLYRDQGQVSDGAKVSFSVELLEGNVQVALVPFVYAEGSVATAELRSANTEPGLVRVTALVTGEDGLLERSLEIRFE